MTSILCPNCGTSEVHSDSIGPHGRRVFSCDRGCEQSYPSDGAPLCFNEEDGMAARQESDRIVAKVNSILQEMVGVGDVLPTDKLRDQLQFDALDLVELAIHLEEAFEIDVPEDFCDDLCTVADLHRWATEHAWRRP